MLVREDHVNADKNYLLCEPIYTEADGQTPGEIFRACRREYGRCTGSVYVDTAEGTKRIGWAFQKRERYQDCGETYLHETWVTLLVKRETVETVQAIE